MKTIGYMDITEGKTIYIYNPKLPLQLNLFQPLQKRYNRINAGLQEIKAMSNIIVYYIKGKKYRPIFKKEL